MVEKYKVRKSMYQYVTAVKLLSDKEDTRVSNLTLSKALGLTPHGTGRELTKLEGLGLVVNKSERKYWKDWELTELGLGLYNDFIGHVTFSEKFANES
jgi:Mn-dependent DtxR family transcriptional regulator